MTLQTLLDKRVLTADGACVGRVYDFTAIRDGREIRITHVCVGVAAWIARLRLPGALRWLFRLAPGFRIPWEAIARVDRDVHLKEAWDRARCETCAIPSGEKDEPEP
jgi:sporulation protein YlmC with PRC-barrel domain